MAEQIFEPGSLPSPTTYQASGAHDIVVLDCYAEFGGSGASGDYKPALRLRSQAGHIIAVAATDETVTAGDDADVSWFRRPIGGAAATPSAGGVAYSRGWFNHPFLGDPAIALTGGVPKRCPFAHVDADPSGAITWTTTTLANDTALLHAKGLYTIYGNVQLSIPGPGDGLLLLTTGLYEQFSDQYQRTLINTSQTNQYGVATDTVVGVFRNPGAVTVSVSLLVMNNNNVNINFGYMPVIYHGVV